MRTHTVESTSVFFATAAIACFTYSVLALLLLHVLRPDYAPAHHMISDYAVGPYGWVMTTFFLAMSGGCLMLLLGLVRSGPNLVAARIGTLLLGVASIGLVVSAIFPTDVRLPLTRTGEIHDMSFYVNIGSIVLAIVLLSVSFGSQLRWRPYRRTALILAALVVLAVVLQFLTLHKGAPYGLANRLAVTVLLAWLLATSIRLRAVVPA
ncbi:DUF998 domain-containing protein [Tunturiibacter gelidoferens]|uniref:Putative membrane protein n=1 Tax=Tunturiibacter lichenicola TaxID=2051959 RepID=A0A7Y9NQB7_9BACT|nr:DUF998 domain-containing protein [Edaphobacter lichenicola]NYF53613.1 putative membrane protein [Edaphobacter lichenicola]